VLQINEEADKKMKLDAAMIKAGGTHPLSEVLLGFLRYEVLRKLSPREFYNLWNRNMNGENFDEMVTDLITK
jgi:hypothetical protein